jgi:hypothetical protein
LMRAVEERVSDQAVLTLLRAMLRAGVMEGGQVRREVTGAPQGSLCAAAHKPPYEQCWGYAQRWLVVPGGGRIGERALRITPRIPIMQSGRVPGHA